MKRLIPIILIFACTYVTAQKPVFNTYFDTSYFFTATDSIEAAEAEFRLDTMVGNRYGKYSKLALKYAESVFGTKVGDGLCGRLGEQMCNKVHATERHKGRVTGTDVGILEVGDLIVFPRFLEFLTPSGIVYASTPAEHLVMFLGMKNDSVMIIAHQNTEGNTFNTKVMVWEVNLKAIRFFNNNTHHVPYFDVYGYEPRRVVKKEYQYLVGK